MSASAENSMWSPVEEASYVSAYSLSGFYDKPASVDEANPEYTPEEEPDYNPLIEDPGTEAKRQGRRLCWYRLRTV